jgi:hypothetical protein
MTEYKLCKVIGGVLRYAVVAVKKKAEHSIEWTGQSIELRKFYEQELELGLRDALCWHVERGGAICGFDVLKLVENLPDTTGASVRCAASMAAWIELGRHEQELELTKIDGLLTITPVEGIIKE